MNRPGVTTWFLTPGWEKHWPKSSVSQLLSHQSFILWVQIRHSGSVSVLSALVDSGATGNFIDHNTLKKHILPMQPLEHLLMIGSNNGGCIRTSIVNHCTELLSLQFSALHHESISFLVTITTKHPIILEFPWICLDDAQISWHDKEITKWSEKCLLKCLHLHASSSPQHL